MGDTTKATEAPALDEARIWTVDAANTVRDLTYAKLGDIATWRINAHMRTVEAQVATIPGPGGDDRKRAIVATYAHFLDNAPVIERWVGGDERSYADVSTTGVHWGVQVRVWAHVDHRETETGGE